MNTAYFSTHYTERLKMVPLTEVHKEPWSKFLGDSRTNKFFPPEARSSEYIEEWFKRVQWRRENNRFGFLALHHKETEEFLGLAGLLTQELEGKDILEVGYHLFYEQWGNGYATEAAKYFKNYAFENNLTDKLYSMIHIENEASKKVARRNGMTPESTTTVWNLPVELFTIYKNK